MINRIILIGNGFDLAHGLKTSYKNFIQDYWFRVIPEFINNSISYKDKFIEIKFQSGLPTFLGDYNFEKTDRSIQEFLSHSQIIIHWKSPFFWHINKTLQDYNWVDIEYEYYLFLKKI